MSNWVLIIFMWAGYGNGGVAIEKVEFNTQAECLAAARQLETVEPPIPFPRRTTVQGRCFKR